MASLVIKKGARPRYLPKKITNYTYTERGEKRVLDYVYTEDIQPIGGYPGDMYFPNMRIEECTTSGDPTNVPLVFSDGQIPKNPSWSYTTKTVVYNQGTPYEFSLDVIIAARLTVEIENHSYTAKIIEFNESDRIIEHYESGRRDYHEPTGKYIITLYGADGNLTKVALARGKLHTFWVKQELFSREIDGRTIYFKGNQLKHEETSGKNGNAILGTPILDSWTIRHTAYSCEVKLELEEE